MAEGVAGAPVRDLRILRSRSLPPVPGVSEEQDQPSAARPAAGEASAARPAAGEATAARPAAGEATAGHAAAGEATADRPAGEPPAEGPGAFDHVTGFFGMRWDDPQRVRLQVRPELINRGGLLSGVATYAMVDYSMGSALWAQTTPEELIATISISINYIQTATEGEVVCRSELDRRNRSIGILKSTVHAEDGRLLVTAVGSYSIFRRKPAR